MKLTNIFKANKRLHKAEVTARLTPIVIYRFCAYKSVEDYENGNHYFMKDFLSSSELQDFSQKHASTERIKHPEYGTMHFRIEGVVK